MAAICCRPPSSIRSFSRALAALYPEWACQKLCFADPVDHQVAGPLWGGLAPISSRTLVGDQAMAADADSPAAGAAGYLSTNRNNFPPRLQAGLSLPFAASPLLNNSYAGAGMGVVLGASSIVYMTSAGDDAEEAPKGTSSASSGGGGGSNGGRDPLKWLKDLFDWLKRKIRGNAEQGLPPAPVDEKLLLQGVWNKVHSVEALVKASMPSKSVANEFFEFFCGARLGSGVHKLLVAVEEVWGLGLRAVLAYVFVNAWTTMKLTPRKALVLLKGWIDKKKTEHMDLLTDLNNESDKNDQNALGMFINWVNGLFGEEDTTVEPTDGPSPPVEPTGGPKPPLDKTDAPKPPVDLPAGDSSQPTPGAGDQPTPE